MSNFSFTSASLSSIGRHPSIRGELWTIGMVAFGIVLALFI